MNKKETIKKISELTDVSPDDCEKVLKALETVLQESIKDKKFRRLFIGYLGRFFSLFQDK